MCGGARDRLTAGFASPSDSGHAVRYVDVDQPLAEVVPAVCAPPDGRDRALVVPLPDESATFIMTGAAGVDPAELTARPVRRRVDDVRRRS